MPSYVDLEVQYRHSGVVVTHRLRVITVTTIAKTFQERLATSSVSRVKIVENSSRTKNVYDFIWSEAPDSGPGYGNADVLVGGHGSYTRFGKRVGRELKMKD